MRKQRNRMRKPAYLELRRQNRDTVHGENAAASGKRPLSKAGYSCPSVMNLT
jgi:hypothetical protein